MKDSDLGLLGWLIKAAIFSNNKHSTGKREDSVIVMITLIKDSNDDVAQQGYTH